MLTATVFKIINKDLSSTNSFYVFDKNNFTNEWKDLRKKCGIDTDLHSLRHTALTAVAEKGTDLAELQNFSRHKDIRSLMEYLHLVRKKTLLKTAEKAEFQRNNEDKK